MSSEVQSEAVDLIVSAIDNVKQTNGTYEAAAKLVKEAMDRKFGPAWHCIIGEGFGFECTHQDKSLVFLYYQGNMAILLFKC
jgi:dynein light chain 4